MEQVIDAEKIAKQKSIGIWSKNLKIVADHRAKFSQFQQITVEVTNVVEPSQFYVRIIGKDNAKIDNAMEHFDPNQAEELEKPIMKGTVCAAKFSADNKWYRCKVIGNAGKGSV